MPNDTVEVIGYTKIIKKHKVLSNITLNLERGHIYGLCGTNGSGKTMLLRAISGLIVPTEGSVIIFGKTLGKEISFPPSMGLIIENVGFWPYCTGFENLKALASIQKKIDDNQIRDSITRVGLSPDDRRTFKKYSLGMKQRLGIAQAVMEKPELILLDEPTNALDDDGVERFRMILREEKERGALIVLASHIKEELRQMCDTLYQVSDGCVKEITSL